MQMVAVTAKGIDKLIKEGIPKRTALGGGLYFSITQSGSASFGFRYKIKGKSFLIGLGAFCSTNNSLAIARTNALMYQGMVRQGIDPKAQFIERKELEKEVMLSAMVKEEFNQATFDRVALEYIHSKSAEWKNAKHHQQWINTLTTYAFPIIGKTPVSEIETAQVLKILKPIWTTKTETATRVRTRIELVLDYAEALKLRSGSNPARWRGHLATILPNAAKIRKIEHHLYGFQSVKKHFSTGAWLKLVKKQINQCLKNKKIPILVGGTGLYFEAITKGMSKIPNIDFKKRDKIRELQKKTGQRKFYELLLKLDPLVKNKIEPSDTQRSIRAYEVKKFTKKSIYEWYKLTKSEFKKFQIFKIFIDVPREKLLKNISNRAEQMFRNDCVKEVKYFLDLNIDPSLPANKIIGVKEIKNLLSGVLGLPQVKEAINIKTRQYAKRQVTWARGHMSDWNKLYSNSFSSLLKKILKVIS